MGFLSNITEHFSGVEKKEAPKAKPTQSELLIEEREQEILKIKYDDGKGIEKNPAKQNLSRAC